jgi:hypothetical protein
VGAGKRLVAKKKMDGWMNRNENTFHFSSRREKVEAIIKEALRKSNTR